MLRGFCGLWIVFALDPLFDDVPRTEVTLSFVLLNYPFFFCTLVDPDFGTKDEDVGAEVVMMRRANC